MSDRELEAQAMGNLHEAALELMEDYGWSAEDICKEVHAVAPVGSA